MVGDHMGIPRTVVFFASRALIDITRPSGLPESLHRLHTWLPSLGLWPPSTTYLTDAGRHVYVGESSYTSNTTAGFRRSLPPSERQAKYARAALAEVTASLREGFDTAPGAVCSPGLSFHSVESQDKGSGPFSLRLLKARLTSARLAHERLSLALCWQGVNAT
jgi:hypothetical protein